MRAALGRTSERGTPPMLPVVVPGERSNGCGKNLLSTRAPSCPMSFVISSGLQGRYRADRPATIHEARAGSARSTTASSGPARPQGLRPGDHRPVPHRRQPDLRGDQPHQARRRAGDERGQQSQPRRFGDVLAAAAPAAALPARDRCRRRDRRLRASGFPVFSLAVHQGYQDTLGTINNPVVVGGGSSRPATSSSATTTASWSSTRTSRRWPRPAPRAMRTS